MIKLSSAHVHTNFCDGNNSAEEMTKAAIELGFVSLGFSSHAFCRHYAIGVGEHNLQKYKHEIDRLKLKYKDDIAIYLGIELDSFSPKLPDVFDYTIGSVHYVKGYNNKFYAVDHTKDILKQMITEGFDGDILAFVKEYYKGVSDMITSLNPTICGHFDLLRRYNGNNEVIDTSNAIYKQYAAEVLQTHAKNVIFEVNTGGMSRGKLPMPYPDSWMLKLICELGGKVMLNSDSHQKETLNAYYDEAQALICAAGFKSAYMLGKNGIEEVEI